MTHTYIHTYIHVYIEHIYIHANAYQCIRPASPHLYAPPRSVYTYTCVHMFTHTFAYSSYIYLCIHTHMNIHVLAHVRTRMQHRIWKASSPCQLKRNWRLSCDFLKRCHTYMIQSARIAGACYMHTCLTHEYAYLHVAVLMWMCKCKHMMQLAGIATACHIHTCLTLSLTPNSTSVETKDVHTEQNLKRKMNTYHIRVQTVLLHTCGCFDACVSCRSVSLSAISTHKSVLSCHTNCLSPCRACYVVWTHT
jgi:hypothetical protein